MKLCSGCTVLKDLTEFHKNKNSKDGHVSQCKECVAKKTKKWREENREKSLQAKRDWHHKSKEKANKSSSEWRKNNPERSAEIKREWLSNNLEHHNEKSQEWVKNNPEKRRETWWLSSYKSRAAKLGFKPILGEGKEEVTVQNIIDKWGDSCFHCKVGEFEELDHYPVAIKNEGTHTISNVRPSCESCNSSFGSAIRWGIDYA